MTWKNWNGSSRSFPYFKCFQFLKLLLVDFNWNVYFFLTSQIFFARPRNKLLLQKFSNKKEWPTLENLDPILFNFFMKCGSILAGIWNNLPLKTEKAFIFWKSLEKIIKKTKRKKGVNFKTYEEMKSVPHRLSVCQ